MIPIVTGLWLIWRHFWGSDHDEKSHLGERTSGIGAALTTAHGVNNVGVYIPVFLSVDLSTILTCRAIFLRLVGGALYLAKCVGSRPKVERTFCRWDQIPWSEVLIGLGCGFWWRGFG